MKIKLSEATPIQLDLLVAKCIRVDSEVHGGVVWLGTKRPFSPTVSWQDGGPIIEREFIELGHYHDKSVRIASLMQEDGRVWFGKGPTPLIAAMRAYVASKLGDEVEVPEELA